MENFKQRENMQMTRIFALKDPNVEVIFVSPYALPKEIISYYFKICELGELPTYKVSNYFSLIKKLWYAGAYSFHLA
jgi:hypothetical protein